MDIVMEQQQIDIPSSWIYLHYNHANNRKQKQCSGRKREDNIKFYRRQNPLAARRRRTVPLETNTANTANSAVLGNSDFIQNQAVPTPSQILLNTVNKIRIERTIFIRNTALRIALPARALQYDAHTEETIEIEQSSNFQQIQNNDNNSSSSDSSDNNDNMIRKEGINFTPN